MYIADIQHRLVSLRIYAALKTAEKSIIKSGIIFIDKLYDKIVVWRYCEM